MKEVSLNFGHSRVPLRLPEQTDVLAMGRTASLSRPEKKIRGALANPIDSPPLEVLVKHKLQSQPEARAVVVISDNTRPVPYRGEEGILYPLVEEMIKAGLPPARIRLLVATGTHRMMSEEELEKMLDPRLFKLEIPILQHDCRRRSELVSCGRTELGSEIFLNRHYLESEIRILTGLVESHFMAGVSGGRKSICPGLISRDSTFILHGASILASPRAADLILDGNPVHEEALRVARMAGCDMTVNVTLDRQYRLTGVFAGNLESGHLAAVDKLRSYAAIPAEKEYDMAVGHAGFVGVNHYQAAKAALACLPVLKKNGFCILACQHTDPDPVGSENYKRMIALLAELGARKFLERILEPAWEFVPDQWEAQMWGKFFGKIPFENLIYCSLEIPMASFSWLPGTDARAIAPEARTLQALVEKSIAWAAAQLRKRSRREPEAAFLADGPYGIPVKKRGLSPFSAEEG